MFRSGKELLEFCSINQCKISRAMIIREMQIFETTEEEIYRRMIEQWKVMESSIKQSLEKDVQTISGLLGGEAKKMNDRTQKNQSVCGKVMSKAITYSMGVMEVSASMGLIVAAPTAGSAGILPGTLQALQEEYGWDDLMMVEALIHASAIGMIIAEQATLSGAEGGCQAETGSAAAMTASAIGELLGLNPEDSLQAAAICLKNVMGLVCDPIAGLVEAPCQKRNAMGSANALISTELVMAGIPSIIPFDEVVIAMGHVGQSIPASLRETALGGLAATPTGCMIKRKMVNHI